MNLRLPRRSLRFRLVLLAASGLLPFALVAALALGYLVWDREEELDAAALGVSRALATAVDAELRSTAAVLDALAQTDELRQDRIESFRPLATRIAQAQGWRSVVVADRAGTLVLNTTVRPGEPASAPVEIESLDQVIATGAWVVGRAAQGRSGRGPAFAVRVPVMHDGQLAYVLSAVIPVERIRDVLMRQHVASGWVVEVLDQTGQRIARIPTTDRLRPSASLQSLIARGGPEGMGTTVTLEGEASHTGFVRVAPSGWMVVTSIGAPDAAAGRYGALAAVATALLASLALAAAVAWRVARYVLGPVDALKSAAVALGSGEPVAVGDIAVAELQEVGKALAQAAHERDRAAQERRQADAERETLLAQRTDALRLAQEAARSKDEFLAMLGHELRNPLAPIATALQLMARKGDNDTRPEREVLERQLGHMTRLVDDLLDVSRITSKRLAMRLQPVNLALAVSHATQGLQALVGARPFVLDLAPGAEKLWVSADPDRLHQVLSNLLGNAVKFTGPQDPITVTLRAAGDDAAEIEVRDGGLGMSAHVLEHVFDLFYQAPQGADRALGGLGLGLPIARSLVEMHGGSLRASSPGPGGGSTFTVRLPTVGAPELDAAPMATTAPARPGRGRVLVVDDNQDAANTAALLLELEGYDVKVAHDPAVALAQLDGFRPDVAVLDIGLPGMSGYELAGRVRAHPHGQQARLLALTGYGSRADVERALAAGFAMHLVKPATPEAFLEAVDALAKAPDGTAPAPESPVTS